MYISQILSDGQTIQSDLTLQIQTTVHSISLKNKPQYKGADSFQHVNRSAEKQNARNTLIVLSLGFFPQSTYMSQHMYVLCVKYMKGN